MSKVRVRDNVYLLDLRGNPVRSIQKRSGLSIEHIHNESSILTFTTSIRETINVEEQLIYRGNRYTVIETERRKNDKLQTITAEIAYLSLADELQSIDREVTSIRTLAMDAVAGTDWTVDRVDSDDRNHSLLLERETALSILRMLATLSNLTLVFDTIHKTVSFVTDTGRDVGFLLRYRKNIQEIKKRVYSPKTTVIYPYGKDGLTIESVNNGKEYVENFDWYVVHEGLSLEEARRMYTKTKMFEDERFVYPGNLKKEAEKRLLAEAFPQIQYDVDVSYLDKDVNVGDYGYVVDEELDIKVNTYIVRLIEYEDSQDNKVELSYLVPDLSNMSFDGSMSGGGGSGGPVTVVGKNVAERKVRPKPEETSVVDVSFTATSDTNVQVGLHIMGRSLGTGLFEAYYSINNGRAETIIMQDLNFGHHTISDTFILSQIPAGTHTLRLMAAFSGGDFTINERMAELYIIGSDLAGGMDSSVPVINVTERVEYPNPYLIEDSATIILG